MSAPNQKAGRPAFQQDAQPLHSDGSSSRRHRTTVLETLLVGALTAYQKLPEDHRPAVGTCVIVERGRDSDVRGRVLGYDARGVAVEAKLAFLGLQRIYLPWSAVKALIEVDA